MDSKSYILLTFIVVLIGFSTAATYYKYVVLNDYEVYITEEEYYDETMEMEVEEE